MPTRKVKGLARNTKYSHSHKILVALEHHKFTQYSVSWPPSANAWIVRHCWTLVQQRLRLRLCTSNNAVYSKCFFLYFYTRLLKILVFNCLSIRPKLQDQDQDQTCKTETKTAAYKTKTKTSFCWSETGLVTRPRSQTTSLLVSSLNVRMIWYWWHQRLVLCVFY